LLDLRWLALSEAVDQFAKVMYAGRYEWQWWVVMINKVVKRGMAHCFSLLFHDALCLHVFSRLLN